ncbi:MAG: hypothetical protein HPY59_16025 [Anaerolineae bacterium]|nr:hypothetical protein [Anaerolineae bacterium]
MEIKAEYNQHNVYSILATFDGALRVRHALQVTRVFYTQAKPYFQSSTTTQLPSTLAVRRLNTGRIE